MDTHNLTKLRRYNLYSFRKTTPKNEMKKMKLYLMDSKIRISTLYYLRIYFLPFYNGIYKRDCAHVCFLCWEK